MGFLTGVGSYVLDFFLNKITGWAWSWIKFEMKKKDVNSKYKQQSDRVDAIRSAIDDLRKANQTIPDSMWQELRDASYIINSNFYN